MARTTELKLEPKECEICGGKYIPTGTRQRFCPACAAGRKHNANYIKARTPGEVVSYTINQPEAPEDEMQPQVTPEQITHQVIEEPEMGTWYEVRIRKDGAVMMEAKLAPEMLSLIIREVR